MPKQQKRKLAKNNVSKKKRIVEKKEAESEGSFTDEDNSTISDSPQSPIEFPPELLEEETDVTETWLDFKSNDDPSEKLNDDVVMISNQYKSYCEHIIDEGQIKNSQQKYSDKAVLSWESLHQINYMTRSSENACDGKSAICELKDPLTNPTSPDELKKNCGIHKTLVKNWFEINKHGNEIDGVAFTGLQNEVFTLLHRYTSLYYPCYDTTTSEEEIRKTYCLHVLNHISQANVQILKNNKRLTKLQDKETEVEYRDQGLVRPKVLILVPFRDRAIRIINIFLSLLKREGRFEVSSFKRFKEEFSPLVPEDSSYDNTEEKMKKKPADHQELFTGNTDEHFRIGIALLRGAFRLYAPFYSSDIIVASPLGLRTVMGEKGESHYAYDFLSSIEILILDHADVFLMQNWEHVLHIIKHLHLQPAESHGVDFSRVYNHVLDGHAKHYCQNIILSSIASPQIASILTKYCYNHRGLAKVTEVMEKGSICNIPKEVPQIFHKLNTAWFPFSEAQDVRFKFFINQILKQIKEKKLFNVLIYLPQYFDFVRLRNHMRRDKKDATGPWFGHVCEYTKPTEVGKAKRRFLTAKFPIMLYSERYHFYHRPNIRGIRHLVFYELPTYPQFYSELCNMVNTSRKDTSISSTSIITVYSVYDKTKLVSVLGDRRAEDVLKSAKHVHMFVTGNQL